jgi:hypothetical protein
MPSAAPRSVGEAAPGLFVSEWINGRPIESLRPGKTHVIEFWSTWAGENWDSIGRLQDRFPDVDFLSVSVWDDSKDAVRAYVARRGTVLKHAVGCDVSVEKAGESRSSSIAREWLEEFGENGLPVYFVVDASSRICSIGDAGRLESVLSDLKSGRHVIDPSARTRERTLQKLELDPNVAIDASVFVESFATRPPALSTADVEWLVPPKDSPPEPLPPAAPAAKSGGLLGRVFGRPKPSETVDSRSASARPNDSASKVFGPPLPGRPVAVLLMDTVTQRSLEPGWNVLNLPDLNALPHSFPEADFVGLIRSHEPLRSTYGDDYCRDLAAWGAELGWRLGADIEESDDSESPTGNETQRFGSFFADRLMFRTLPAAALIDGQGKLIWAGSPLRLAEALEKWRAGDLSDEWAAEDLLFWYRLLASCAANERLAGVGPYAARQDMRLGAASLFQGESYDADEWLEIVAGLTSLLPWRAHDWTVFEFVLATRPGRRSGSSDDASGSILDRLEDLTNRFEAAFRSMSPDRLDEYDYDPLAQWRMTVLAAIDHLGLLKDGAEPLDGTDLFAVESLPLTQAIVDSAKRLEQCAESIPQPSFFEPSLWPLLMLKLGHAEDAEKGFAKDLDRFDRFVEACRSATDSTDIRELLGTDPTIYRKTLEELKAMCR